MQIFYGRFGEDELSLNHSSVGALKKLLQSLFCPRLRRPLDSLYLGTLSRILWFIGV